jgi:hypothetical protein
MRRIIAAFLAGLLAFASPALAQTSTSGASQPDQVLTDDANQAYAQAPGQPPGAPPPNSFPCTNSLGETALCALVGGAIVVVAVLASQKSNDEFVPQPQQSASP